MQPLQPMFLWGAASNCKFLATVLSEFMGTAGHTSTVVALPSSHLQNINLKDRPQAADMSQVCSGPCQVI